MDSSKTGPILMKPLVVSRCFSLLSYLFCTLALLGSSGKAMADADTGVQLALPLQFDLRERISKPDLAPVPRIRFLTTVDFPPFNFVDQSGKLSGFHVDLAREICRELGVLDRCQIEAVAYGDLLQTLDNRGGEVVLAGTRISPDLRKSHDFSRTFVQLPARFVISNSAKSSVTSPDMLPPGQVGVVKDTAHQQMLAAFFPSLKPTVFASRPEMLAALIKGDVKAAFGDGLQLSFWLESTESNNCCSYLGGSYYSRFFLGEGLAMMTRKDEPQITRALDHALLALTRNGRMNEIYLRYFPNGL
jgi:polar amino acid transport system substrate-binding protein